VPLDPIGATLLDPYPDWLIAGACGTAEDPAAAVPITSRVDQLTKLVRCRLGEAAGRGA
jgi:hypothetical protein